MTGDLAFAIRTYFYKVFEKIIDSNSLLEFFAISFKNEKNRFEKIKEALIEAKGSAWVNSSGESSLFVFFKPKNRNTMNPMDVVPEIQKTFENTKKFGVPKDSDIAKISVNGSDFWAIKIEFE